MWRALLPHKPNCNWTKQWPSSTLMSFSHWENGSVEIYTPNDAHCSGFKALANYKHPRNSLKQNWLKNDIFRQWQLKMILGCQRWKQFPERITTSWVELKVVHSKIKVANTYETRRELEGANYYCVFPKFQELSSDSLFFRAG